MTTMNKTRPLSVKTTRFGEITVEEELIITLQEGLIGFEDCTKYVVLHQNPENPFRWLQSLDDGAIAFPVMDPWQFKPEYNPSISDADAAFLDLDEQKPKLVFVILTVPHGNPRGITANLLGPIVVNPLTKQGKQVILSDDKYTTKHSIMEEILRMKKKN